MAVWTVLGQFVAAVLFVDFFSGLVHWFEDQYGSERMPPWVVEYIVRPNRLHHIYPRKVVHCPRWISVAQGLGPAILFFPLTIALLGWTTGLMASALSTLPNFVHKWNHQRDSERPRFVTLLQKLHILQSPQQHHGHHIGETDVVYCVVTPFLNPILDAIGFWRRLEGLVYLVTRVRANSPQEPHRYYRVENGTVMEYLFSDGVWREWPEFDQYQRPVR